MPVPKKDDRSGGSGRVQNGNRSGFRTDTAISNSRYGNERTLKAWVPDNADTFGDSLEGNSSSGAWDQFAANEKLFGLQTDYDENMYTTAIDKSHPQYRERAAAAERKAREIERSTAVTSHVAEERIMDFAGGGDLNGDEEDKYSGVKRQDPAPPSGRENKYMPPAKRAPTSKATVIGAPVDPAIISSQLRVSQPKKAGQQGATTSPVPTPKPAEESKAPNAPEKAPTPRPDQTKGEKTSEAKSKDVKTTEPSSTESKPADNTATPSRSPAVPSATSTRGTTPKTGEATPSATATVERDVLNSFKSFARGQRNQAERVRIGKAKADKEVKLTELKNFASTFKLSTPVPSDLISIIAKDPARQKEIQAKALQNAEEVLRSKDVKPKEVTTKETPPKQSTEPSTPAPAEQKPAPRPTPSHTSSHPNSQQNRHGGGRQAYGASNFNGQQFRNDRGGQHPPQPRTTGNLAQRIKMHQTPQVSVQIDGRVPPTAPTGGNDGSFNRRLSGTPGHANKLNPNTQEFRPNAFAPSFSPANPSTASSPRSNVTSNLPDAASASPVRQLIRRKTKAVDCKKCDILAHVKTTKALARNGDDNAGLRPTYDTPPTWRQLLDEKEKSDSTMLLTYKQYFERNPFAGPPGAVSTPNPSHIMPMAHQHQLPFHLQHGAHNMPARPSPHMPPMQMHVPPQHTPHVGYASTDDHRMMHSNSAQSFASPRMAQAPVYAPAVNSPAQVPYGQPVMQPYAPTAPHMGQYRSFSNNPQYMPQQPGHMGSPMMVQHQFVAGPQGMMMAPPQMQMFHTSQGQFIPPGAVAVPPQPITGSNGYPSPGRPAAPPMSHQGSAQGQPYVNNARGYGSPAAHHYGSSPQHMHHFGGPQHRAGSNNYGNKNYNAHGQQHQMNQNNHTAPSGPQARAPDGPEEAK